MASARGTNYATTDIARYLFGNNITSQEARKIWETSSTETQCTHSTGAGAFQNGRTTCYICGMTITKSGIDNDGRNPECEHILPAFTALGYKGLIQSQNVDNLTDDEKKFFTYEYANAHRCCNQNKSDDKWIKYIEDRPFNDKRYYISNEKVKKLGWNIKVGFLDGLQELV